MKTNRLMMSSNLRRQASILVSVLVLNVVLNGVAIQVTNLVYFFKMAPGMVTCLNTSIGNKSRSTTDFGKGR
jgi:hypothetical protein